MERIADDKWGREVWVDGETLVCRDAVGGAEFSVRHPSRERALSVIEGMLTDGCYLKMALDELADSPDGMGDPVLLVGGPLADQVVDWPEPSAWQSVRSWVGAADTRSFSYGSQTVVYRRVGGTAGVA